MYKLIIVLIATFLLTGCGTIPVTKVEVAKRPAALIKLCDYAPPPDIEEYKLATWTEKEKMWKKSYDLSMLLTSLCNARLIEMGKLNAEY